MKKKKSGIEILILHVALIGIFVIITLLKTIVFGGSCPLQLLFHIPCLFCGMTRAHVAALRLDFEAAFAAHPLFMGGIPYLFLLFHPQIFSGKLKIVRKIVLGILTVAFIITYIVQCFEVF